MRPTFSIVNPLVANKTDIDIMINTNPLQVGIFVDAKGD